MRVPAPILIAVALVALAWFLQEPEPFRKAPVGYIDEEPSQKDAQIVSFEIPDYGLFAHRYLIIPRAVYEIKARVLHMRRYRSERYTGNLVAFDIGLGWKGMSDSETLSNYFLFDHRPDTGGGRFLWTEYKNDENGRFRPPPASVGGISEQLSNNHVVPADKHVFRQLLNIKAGDMVWLRGYLVDIEDPTRPWWKWQTSLTRTDTSTHWGGNNTSCETMYVMYVDRIASTHPYVIEPIPEALWLF